MQIHRLLLLSLALAGCGSMGKASRPVAELPPEALAHLRARDHYATPTTDGKPDKAHAGLVEAVRRGLPAGYQPLVQYDPALDAAAAVLAETYARHSRGPTRRVSDWVVAQSGETGVYLRGHLDWAQGGRDPRSRAVDGFSDFARKLVLSRAPHAFGVARVEVWPGRFGAAVVLIQRPISVEPLPRSLPAGRPTPLRGRLNILATDLRLQLSGPTPVSVPLNVQGDAFEVVIPALPAGEYMMEITGRRATSNPDELENWRVSLLLLPLAVGQPPARRPPARLDLPFDDDLTDRERLRAEILAWFNDLRARSGLAPLELHAGLSAMLTTRSEAAAASGTSEPGTTLEAQARGLGILPGHRFRETWGRTSWLSDRLERLAGKPRLLELMNAPEARYLGVDLEVTPAEGRGRPWFRYRLAVAGQPAGADASSD